jgi:hypothetical protein
MMGLSFEESLAERPAQHVGSGGIQGSVSLIGVALFPHFLLILSILFYDSFDFSSSQRYPNDQNGTAKLQE